MCLFVKWVCTTVPVHVALSKKCPVYFMMYSHGVKRKLSPNIGSIAHQTVWCLACNQNDKMTTFHDIVLDVIQLSINKSIAVISLQSEIGLGVD